MRVLAARRRKVFELFVAFAALLALVVLAAVVGALQGWLWVAGLAVIVAVLGFVYARLRRRVPPRTILEVDLDRELAEHVPALPGAGLVLGRPLTSRNLVETLQRAANDPRVSGLIARVGSAGLGLGRAQEIWEAVIAFRASGKRAVAYAETFGEGGPAALTDYLLASAFDEVYLQPSGELGLVGLRSDVPFLRGALDKVGVLPDLDHREEYKTAANTLTEKGFTASHREAAESLVGAQYTDAVTGIAAARGLPVDAVRAAVDSGPLLAAEALEAGFVDGLAFRDEVYDEVKDDLGGPLMYLDRYRQKAGGPHRKGARIALVYVSGLIARGEGRFSPLPRPGFTAGSDTIAGALRDAIRDPKIEAIVLRVDSPGGSAVASEVIWREVVRAREQGTPVVVSMADVAASGGYYIAAGADRIVAEPGTITGSIGVVSGKLATREAWRKLGVEFDSVERGANAAMASPLDPYSGTGRERLEAQLDDIYRRFRRRVEDGRGLSEAEVLERAKGRVWTGLEAHELGLVDELGGLATALEIAKEQAGIAATDPIRVVEFPRQRRVRPGPAGDSSEALTALVRQGLAATGPIARGAALAGLFAPGELTLPPEWWR